MSTHILGISYKPKDAAVRDGICRQTIRPVCTKKPRKVGDDALLHGWSGRPYYSMWSWRRSDVLREVIGLIATSGGFWEDDAPYAHAKPGTSTFYTWDDLHAHVLARLDFIDPPTGPALRDVLDHFHDLSENILMQILRW